MTTAITPRFRPGRSGLRFRVMTLVGIGVLVPAALVAGLFWSRLSELDARLLRSRQGAAVAVADHLDEELTGDLEALQRIASSLTPSLEGHGADAKEREVLRRGYLGFRFVGGVFLLDAQGDLLLEEPARERPAVPAPDLPELREVLRTGKPRVSGLVREGEGYRIYALVAVMDWRGRLSGVVGGLIDPALARQTAVLRHLRQGQEGHAELVDRAGTVLASTDRDRLHAPGTCPALTERIIREREPMARRCSDCHGQGSPASVIAGAPLRNAPWAVTVVQSEDAVLATSGAVPGNVTLFALGVLLLAGAFAWGAARSVTHPVEQLTAEAEKIAGGQLGDPIPELGSDEIGRLGVSLDRMRASLAGMVDQLGQARGELEHRVEERTRELAEANEKLRDRDQQRARLLQTVITAQEDERKRVARELHDETTQSLAVLVMGLESAAQALRAGGPTPRLDEVKALAVHILDEIHRLILDLRPSVLDDLGLYSAVRWYAERHLQAKGLAVRCEMGDAPAQRLPPQVEIAVFRICQEAMNNIERHARAESVLIQLEAAGGELRIEIEDDGQGFDPVGPGSSDRPHFGIQGIRERAHLLGGSATIDSGPGQGTRVEVRIPLAAPAAEGPSGDARATRPAG